MGAFDNIPPPTADTAAVSIPVSDTQGIIQRPGQPMVAAAAPTGAFDSIAPPPKESTEPVKGPVATFIDTLGEHMAVPGKPEWNLSHAADYINSQLPSWMGLGAGDSMAKEAADLKAGQEANPTATTTGELGGRVTAVLASTLATGGLGPLASGAAGGAAALPEHPVSGALAGATGTAILGTATRLGGAVLSKLPPKVADGLKDVAMKALPEPFSVVLKQAGKFPAVAEELKKWVGNLVNMQLGQKVIARAAEGKGESGDTGAALADAVDDIAAAAVKE